MARNKSLYMFRGNYHSPNYIVNLRNKVTYFFPNSFESVNGNLRLQRAGSINKPKRRVENRVHNSASLMCCGAQWVLSLCLPTCRHADFGQNLCVWWLGATRTPGGWIWNLWDSTIFQRHWGLELHPEHLKTAQWLSCGVIPEGLARPRPVGSVRHLA